MFKTNKNSQLLLIIRHRDMSTDKFWGFILHIGFNIDVCYGFNREKTLESLLSHFFLTGLMSAGLH